MRKQPRKLHPRGRPAPPPPPLTRSPGEPLLPGATILEENEPRAAVALWQTLQDVTLWATVGPENRGPGLFHSKARRFAEQIPELKELLLSDLRSAQEAASWALRLSETRKEHRPETVARKILSEIRTRESTEDSGSVAADRQEIGADQQLATRFISAVRRHPRIEAVPERLVVNALFSPVNSECALQIATQARSSAEYERAELWYRRASELARVASNPEESIRSLAGLANLHHQQGALESALQVHEEALSLARQLEARELEADTLLDLCMLHFQRQEGSRGFARAREALATYPPGHPKLARLAHNVAVFLMNERGDFVNSLVVFEAITENNDWPRPDQLLLQANLAWAAAGAGEAIVFDRAWERARILFQQSRDQESHAAALINLGHAALSLGRTEWAEIQAVRAKRIAGERREARNQGLARDLIQQITEAKRTRARKPHFPSPDHDPGEARTLAQALVRALRAHTSRRFRTRTPARERL